MLISQFEKMETFTQTCVLTKIMFILIYTIKITHSEVEKKNLSKECNVFNE